tara:strand:+ start:239 stop:427 length:189 start_codon:yes stop_codon:yes gene_type:complete
MDKIIEILQASKDLLNNKELEELKTTLVNAHWNKCYNEMEIEFISQRNSINNVIDKLINEEG